MRVGYVRVSTVGQNTARQEVLMEELGAERVYIDRMSGKSTSRPAAAADAGIRPRGRCGGRGEHLPIRPQYP